MTDSEYGCLIFQDREIVVAGDVPQRMFVAPDYLFADVRRGIYVLESGVVTFGRHEDGGHVWYHIVGWDPVRRALVLELDATMREVGKR